MKKFAIIHGEITNGLQKRAIEELTKILLEYTLEYPVCINAQCTGDLSDFKPIYIGTRATNTFIASTPDMGLSSPESYSISIKDSVTAIEGYDDAGVLYGVLDFYNQYVVKYEYPDLDHNFWVNFLTNDELPDFEYSSAPSVKERGLWTWGHVIYDYKGYLDNLMKLKMNRLIIWNDHAPINGNDIVEYAHDRNIKIIWGFSWLWDTSCHLMNISNISDESTKIFDNYEKHYAPMKGDGIYFQTFTELNDDNIGGVLVARAAADFVNQTAALFYEKYPNIEIQFGLHASSVKDHLDFISSVDKRIRIVWEDCGAFPFSYFPNDIAEFEETKRLAKAISDLRGDDDRFGIVPKGLVKLDWNAFEHLKGAQCIGVSSDILKSNRIERKRRIWKVIQAYWITNADKAYEMFKFLCEAKNGDMLSAALVEDGMFEENIMYPVALYAEMLWNCNGNVKDIMSNVAKRGYIAFA